MYLIYIRSHHWGKIPNTHNFREERLVLAHSFSWGLLVPGQIGDGEEKLLTQDSQEAQRTEKPGMRITPPRPAKSKSALSSSMGESTD